MTHFFQKNAARGFHIDYCFVHRSLKIEDVSLPAFEAWRNMSDHVPLVVTVTDASKYGTHSTVNTVQYSK